MEDSIRLAHRLFDILEIVAASNERLTLTQIAQKSGLSKSTVYRLLSFMKERGYAEKDRDGGYSVGAKLIEIAGNHINSLELQTESRPILAELKRSLGLTVHMGILDGADVIYIEKMDIYPTARLYTQVGYRSPAYCSSMGKCLLAALSGDELEEALYGLTFEPFTQNTVKSFKELKAVLKKARDDGYAMDSEEYVAGHRCVGAPVFDYRGDVIAAVSASGSTDELTDALLPEVIEKVKRAAGLLSKRMGCTL